VDRPSKPHSKHYGDIGAAYAAIATSLNSCGRLLWEIDTKARASASAPFSDGTKSAPASDMRATGAEEEHVECDVLVNDFIKESDDSLAGDADRRKTTRARDAAVAEGVRKAGDMAMRRQIEPAEVEADLERGGPGDDDADEVNEGGRKSTETVHRGRRSSTPSPGGSSSFAIGECMEGEKLRLMQAVELERDD
jgi:hypothetical protein